MAHNIQMNYYDGSSYQELNPRTLLANVTDWQDNIYSKTEVDTIKNTLQGNITNIEENILKNINKYIFYTSFNVSTSDTVKGSVIFSDYIYNYKKIIIDFRAVAGRNIYVKFFNSDKYNISANNLCVYEVVSFFK